MLSTLVVKGVLLCSVLSQCYTRVSLNEILIGGGFRGSEKKENIDSFFVSFDPEH